MGRGLDVDQVAVQAVELGVAIGHLLVDRRQLLVGGLQLLLGRLQLLVDALQLLVGGLDLLVGGLELLVRRLVLLLDGLQVVARLGELGFELGDAARLAAARRPGRSRADRPRRVAAGAVRCPGSASSNTIRKQRSRRFFSGMTSTFTVRVVPSCSTRTFSLRAVVLSFLALLMAARSGSINPSRAIFSTSKLALPAGRLEVRAGRAAELQDLQLRVHEHGGRGELIDGDAVGLALRVELGSGSLRRPPLPACTRSGAPAPGAGPRTAARRAPSRPAA